MRSAAEEIVSAILAKWAAAFSKLDDDALASLYSRNALFFGSNPKLYRGTMRRAYFQGPMASPLLNSPMWVAERPDPI
jgi:ketosteroid isomerase-like protein